MVRVRVSELQWKKALEGLRRGDIEACEHVNGRTGKDCFRSYCRGSTTVMLMCVEGAASDKHALDCKRWYELTQEIIDATDHIFIPSAEDFEAWEDAGLDSYDEMVKIDPGWAQ